MQPKMVGSMCKRPAVLAGPLLLLCLSLGLGLWGAHTGWTLQRRAVKVGSCVREIVVCTLVYVLLTQVLLAGSHVMCTASTAAACVARQPCNVVCTAGAAGAARQLFMLFMHACISGPAAQGPRHDLPDPTHPCMP